MRNKQERPKHRKRSWLLGTWQRRRLLPPASRRRELLRPPAIESTRLDFASSGLSHAPPLAACAQRQASSPEDTARSAASAPATVPASPGNSRALHLQGAPPSPDPIHDCHHVFISLAGLYMRLTNDWRAGRRRRSRCSTLCLQGTLSVPCLSRCPTGFLKYSILCSFSYMSAKT